MAEPAERQMTIDEFLEWDDSTDARYEWMRPVTHSTLYSAARGH